MKKFLEWLKQLTKGIGILIGLLHWSWQIHRLRKKNTAQLYQHLAKKEGFSAPEILLSRQQIIDLLEDQELSFRPADGYTLMDHLLHEICFRARKNQGWEYHVWLKTCIQLLVDRGFELTDDQWEKMQNNLEGSRARCWLALWEPPASRPDWLTLPLADPPETVVRTQKQARDILEIGQMFGKLDYLLEDPEIREFVSWVPGVWEEPELRAQLFPTDNPAIQAARSLRGNRQDFRETFPRLLDDHPRVALRVVQIAPRKLQLLERATWLKGLSHPSGPLRKALMRASPYCQPN